jgi:hypothetical protein
MLPVFGIRVIKDALGSKLYSVLGQAPFYWSNTEHDKAKPYVVGTLVGNTVDYYQTGSSDYKGVLQLDIWGDLNLGPAPIESTSDTILKGIGQQYVNFSGSGYSGCIYIQPEIIGDATPEMGKELAYRCTHQYIVYTQET